MISETFERITAAVSECGPVWCTGDSCYEVSDKWRWHLWTCVRAKGRHFKHLL